MRPRPLKLQQALRMLPELDDLLPLREALIGVSHEDRARAWTGAREYETLDKRLADSRRLEEQIPALVELVRARTERVFRHVTRAMGALERGETAEAARELVFAGEVEEAARRLTQAEQYYQRALELGRKPRDRQVEGLALRRLGRVARAQGRSAEALDLYGRGFEVAEAQRDREGMVVSCQGLGNLYIDQGLWEEARDWYARGVAILEGEAPSRFLWELYSNLAVVERRTGNLERSETWLERAAAVLDTLGDERGRVYLENGWGRLYLARGEPEAAEKALRRALSAADDSAVEAYVLVNLAEVLLVQERLRDAEEVARKAEEQALGQRVVPVLPEVYRLLGEVARRRRDSEGFVFFEQALELGRNLDLPALENARTQHQYGLFEAMRGEVEAARARLRAAKDIYQRLGSGPELEQVTADLVQIEADTSPSV